MVGRIIQISGWLPLSEPWSWKVPLLGNCPEDLSVTIAQRTKGGVAPVVDRNSVKDTKASMASALPQNWRL